MNEPSRIKYHERISIVGIRVIKGNISCPNDFTHDIISGFKTHFEVTHGVDIEHENLRFLFTSQFIAIDEQENSLSLTAEYTFEFVFHVSELNDFMVMNESNDLKGLNAELGITLVGILYSTARGMILARTQGTVIANGIIIPIIDVATLMKNSKSEEHSV